MSAPYKLVCQVITTVTEFGKVEVVGYQVIGFGPDENIVLSQTYVGDNAIASFLQDIIQFSSHLIDKQKYDQLPLILEDEDVDARAAATTCAICKCVFDFNPTNGIP